MNLFELENHRIDIIKAEIGVLLFNLGKTHIGFWKENSQTKMTTQEKTHFENEYGFKPFKYYKDYYEKNHFEEELDKINPELKDFFLDKDKHKVNLNNSEINWIEFFKGGESKEDCVKKIFFRGCENINSGIDKGSPDNNNQIKCKLWISNVFGSFEKIVDENNFDKKRNCFLASLNDFCLENNFYNKDLILADWVILRNFIFEKIESWYSNLLSDSRYPVNDVTL